MFKLGKKYTDIFIQLYSCIYAIYYNLLNFIVDSIDNKS
jgi:hypothetical protein